MFSIKIIYDSFDDWDDNPLITNVEDFEAPLNNIEFPAITVIHEPDYQTDNWALPELILNFFEFTCSKSSEDCQKTENLRQDFKPFLDHVYNQMSSLILQSNIDDQLLNELISLNETESLEKVLQAILANKISLSDLEKILKNSIGKYSEARGSQSFIEQFVPETNTSLGCEDNCTQLVNDIKIFLLKVVALDVRPDFGFGTFLRIFASGLGNTFKLDRDTSLTNRKQCHKIGNLEMHFHELMMTIGQKMGLKSASLYDIPSFYKIQPNDNNQETYGHNYPLYSFCKYLESKNDTRLHLPECFSMGWDKVFRSANWTQYHPYKRYLDDFCSNGVKDITDGASLEVIMEIMKFSHHLSTYEDIEKLYGRLRLMNFSYPLANFKKMINKKYYQISHGRSFIMRTDIKQILKFRPIITNAGIGSTWNGQAMDKVFQDLPYTRLFNMTFQTHFKDEPIAKVEQKKNFIIYIDKHEDDFYDRVKSEQSFW